MNLPQLLNILRLYDVRHNGDQQSTRIILFGDGSGFVVAGRDETMKSFSNLDEAITFLTTGPAKKVITLQKTIVLPSNAEIHNINPVQRESERNEGPASLPGLG